MNGSQSDLAEAVVAVNRSRERSVTGSEAISEGYEGIAPPLTGLAMTAWPMISVPIGHHLKPGRLTELDAR